MTVWTDPGQCSSCKFCAIEPQDMDPFCMHPKVLKRNRFGLYIDSAIELFCTDKLTMREPRNGSL